MNKLKHTCPHCGRNYTPDLAKEKDFKEKSVEWICGKLIQDVWPHATEIQREQLITGICSDECWDKVVYKG